MLQNALNSAIQKRNKPLKAMYDPSTGRLSGVASTMHEQVSWAKIKELIEKIVLEQTGEVVEPEDSVHPFKWSYRVPGTNKNVSTWVGVHAGNNIIKGKSGIRIFSRFRTEREGGAPGGARIPACHNWCGMWQFPQQFFKIDLKELRTIQKVIGAENVENIQMLQFHLKPDMEQFQKDLTSGISKMIKSMAKVTVVIDKSIKSPLNRNEMQNILWAYQSKSKSYLPDYIIEQIMKAIEEETVWGFSQAVSWVRTHGNFKFTDSTNAMFKTVEDRDLTWRLENIAGEVLSLTPTINDIHKQGGEITLEFLVGDEEARRIREAQVKQEVIVQAVKA